MSSPPMVGTGSTTASSPTTRSGGAPGEGGRLRVVDHRGVAVRDRHLGRAAQGLGHARGDARDPLRHGVAECLVEGADGPESSTASGITLKAWPPWMAPMVTTAASTGRHLAGDQRLQRGHHVGRRHHRVGRPVRLAPVAAPAAHRDLEPVHRRHERPRLHPQRAHLELVPEVDAQHDVHAVEDPVLHHRLRAALALLGGLEQQAHFAPGARASARARPAPWRPPRPWRCGRRGRRRASPPAPPRRRARRSARGGAARPCPPGAAPWGRSRPRARASTPVPPTPVRTSRPAPSRKAATRAAVRVSWKASSGWRWRSRRSSTRASFCAADVRRDPRHRRESTIAAARCGAR